MSLETRVIRNFGCSEFGFCFDSRLGGIPNRFFNSLGNRSHVITHSLKKMKKEEREIVMKPTQFRIPSSDELIEISTPDETVFNTVYCTEMTPITGKMDKTLIVTYPSKYRVSPLASKQTWNSYPNPQCGA